MKTYENGLNETYELTTNVLGTKMAKANNNIKNFSFTGRLFPDEGN